MRRIDRFDKYMIVKGLNDNQVTIQLQLSVGILGKSRKENRDLSDKVIEKILNFYTDLNRVWLLTGEGEMLRGGDTEEKVTAKERSLIPFYDDVTTVGGVNRLTADDGSHTHPTEWIDAGDWFPEATSAIRHYGDSMVEYPSGSILALKRVNDKRLIIWGRNYSIETTEFRITKRLQDGGDDFILAYSSNESTYADGSLIHSPIRIPKETVRHIDLVLGCVTKEYSNGVVGMLRTGM